MAKARTAGRPRAPNGAGERGVELILERIRSARNFDFRNYKRATILRRIQRRMGERRCRGLLEVWQQPGRRAIPRLLSEKNPREPLRVRCAGRATGEEAFTVAILLCEDDTRAARLAAENERLKGRGARKA